MGRMLPMQSSTRSYKRRARPIAPRAAQLASRSATAAVRVSCLVYYTKVCMMLRRRTLREVARLVLYIALLGGAMWCGYMIRALFAPPMIPQAALGGSRAAAWAGLAQQTPQLLTSSSGEKGNTANTAATAAAAAAGAATAVAAVPVLQPLPTPAPPSLPEGWEERRNAVGKPYYIDHNTETTHWQRPPVIAAHPAADASRDDANSATHTSSGAAESTPATLPAPPLPLPALTAAMPAISKASTHQPQPSLSKGSGSAPKPPLCTPKQRQTVTRAWGAGVIDAYSRVVPAQCPTGGSVALECDEMTALYCAAKQFEVELQSGQNAQVRPVVCIGVFPVVLTYAHDIEALRYCALRNRPHMCNRPTVH